MIINTIGLTIGIFVAILLVNFFIQESTYDHYHSKADRIHKVISRVAFSEGQFKNFGISLGSVAADFKEGFSQVEDAVRLYGPFEIEADISERRYNNNEVLFADYSFFDVFDFPGISSSAFDSPTDAIVSRQFADRLETDDPIGTQVSIEDISYTIAAVVDIPHNTSFRFDVMIPLESDPFIKDIEDGGLEFETFVLLSEEGNNSNTIELLKGRYDELTGSKWPLYQSDNFLIPLKEVYLSDGVTSRFGNGNRQLLGIILSISFLVIALALINYINIQVANNHSRTAELKLKKIMGAGKMVLIKQGVLESLLVIGFSCLAAIFLLESFYRSSFTSIIGDQLVSMEHWPLNFWLVFALIILISGVISGAIPAIKLFSLKSITQQSIKAKKLGKLTVSLVIFQFFVSSSLLTAILFINAQMNFMRGQPTGYDSEQVIVIENLSEKHKEDYQLIKERLEGLSSIQSVAGSQNKPGSGASGQSIYRMSQTKEDGTSIAHIRTIDGYAETLGLEFIAGGDFTVKPSDEVTQFILNKTAADMLFTPDEDPIGELVNMSGRKGRVVGVVEDFHYLSFHYKISPLAINVEQPHKLTLMAKVSSDNVDQSLESIASVLSEVDPLYVFDYQFLDDQFDQLYQSELRDQKIITSSTLVALSISIMGLLALSIFVINSKLKEIAIRKALGGSNGHIFYRLSINLIVWIFIGNLISIPASYYVTKNWVQDFVYQLDLQNLIWMVPVTATLTLLVALLAVINKLYKTINLNPIVFLRYE